MNTFVLCTPGEYGVPRPWYFIFQMNYWGGVPLEAGMPIPPAPTEQDEGTRLWKLLHNVTRWSLYTCITLYSITAMYICCHSYRLFSGLE